MDAEAKAILVRGIFQYLDIAERLLPDGLAMAAAVEWCSAKADERPALPDLGSIEWEDLKMEQMPGLLK